MAPATPEGMTALAKKPPVKSVRKTAKPAAGRKAAAKPRASAKTENLLKPKTLAKSKAVAKPKALAIPKATAKPEPKAPRAPSKVTSLVLACLDDMKAENVVSIDLEGKTSIADLMVIATGRSTTHVGSIADRIVSACKSAGLPTPRVEGVPNCDWVLVDASDVIVHIFRPEVREFYNLEKMWGGDRPADSGAERRLASA